METILRNFCFSLFSNKNFDPFEPTAIEKEYCEIPEGVADEITKAFKEQCIVEDESILDFLVQFFDKCPRSSQFSHFMVLKK